jgi:hypothetical protein
MSSAERKAVIRQLVDEVINGRRFDMLDDLCAARLAPKVRLAFEQFLEAFPDWHQEIRELVAERDTVVARFRCTGTHRGTWQGLAPTNKTMRVEEVYFFRFTDQQITGMWGLEDTWTRIQQLTGSDTSLGDLGSLS